MMPMWFVEGISLGLAVGLAEILVLGRVPYLRRTVGCPEPVRNQKGKGSR